MKTIKVIFTGRKSGAIGITYSITEIITVAMDASDEAINLALHYAGYEHIKNIEVYSV